MFCFVSPFCALPGSSSARAVFRSSGSGRRVSGVRAAADLMDIFVIFSPRPEEGRVESWLLLVISCILITDPPPQPVVGPLLLVCSLMLYLLP